MQGQVRKEQVECSAVKRPFVLVYTFLVVSSGCFTEFYGEYVERGTEDKSTDSGMSFVYLGLALEDALCAGCGLPRPLYVGV